VGGPGYRSHCAVYELTICSLKTSLAKPQETGLCRPICCGFTTGWCRFCYRAQQILAVLWIDAVEKFSFRTLFTSTLIEHGLPCVFGYQYSAIFASVHSAKSLKSCCCTNSNGGPAQQMHILSTHPIPVFMHTPQYLFRYRKLEKIDWIDFNPFPKIGSEHQRTNRFT
jgi:hypothetical protein